MTVTLDPQILEALEAAPVPYDFYREVHKGLRHALFDVTFALGAADCADPVERDDVVGRMRAIVALLHSHHAHEDGFIKPLLDVVDPQLSARVDQGHVEVDDDIAAIETMADVLATCEGGAAVAAGLDLYLRVARFVATYLAHMAIEECEVMPVLRSAMTVTDLFEVDMALRASIPPDKLLAFSAIMLPAMNVEERTAMLGGLRAGAPAEIFEEVRRVAERALEPDDYGTVAWRLGLS